MLFHSPGTSELLNFGMNWPAVWVKMASSWLCILVYLVTIFFPKIIPGRDLSLIHAETLSRRKNRKQRGGGASAGDGTDVEEGQELEELQGEGQITAVTEQPVSVTEVGGGDAPQAIDRKGKKGKKAQKKAKGK